MPYDPINPDKWSSIVIIIIIIIIITDLCNQMSRQYDNIHIFSDGRHHDVLGIY